jgi:3',5'-cyclic AMP phosphodiesterase CpdA
VVILTGDATDCGLDEEFAILNGLLDRLPMPVYVVPGNHDRRESMRAALGPKGYLPASGPLDFVVETRPVRLIGLDTLVAGESHGALAEASIAFLEATLAREPTVPTLVFLHHPPFDCGIGHMDRIRLLDGVEAFRTVIARHPQVERVVTATTTARWPYALPERSARSPPPSPTRLPSTSPRKAPPASSSSRLPSFSTTGATGPVS